MENIKNHLINTLNLTNKVEVFLNDDFIKILNYIWKHPATQLLANNVLSQVLARAFNLIEEF